MQSRNFGSSKMNTRKGRLHFRRHRRVPYGGTAVPLRNVVEGRRRHILRPVAIGIHAAADERAPFRRGPNVGVRQSHVGGVVGESNAAAPVQSPPNFSLTKDMGQIRLTSALNIQPKIPDRREEELASELCSSRSECSEAWPARSGEMVVTLPSPQLPGSGTVRFSTLCSSLPTKPRFLRATQARLRDGCTGAEDSLSARVVVDGTMQVTFWHELHRPVVLVDVVDGHPDGDAFRRSERPVVGVLQRTKDGC